MQISTRQINQTELTLAIQQGSSGTAFSNNIAAYVLGGGWLGNSVVYTTGAVDITGVKTFRDSPLVPYSSPTGGAVNKKYVDDSLLLLSGNSLSALVTTSGALVALNLATSGVLRASINAISGGGSSTGSSVGTGYSGYVENNFVNRTSDQAISGIKTFADPVVFENDATFQTTVDFQDLVAFQSDVGFNAPVIFTDVVEVPNPATSSEAANLSTITSASGSLRVTMSGISGVLYRQMTGISGAIGGGVINTYNITGTGIVTAISSGVVTNTFNITSGNISVSNSGSINNTFNGTTTNNISLGTVTGNFVNINFWFDEYTLGTGLNMIEAIVARNFTFTGYAIAVINTGTQGVFSGSIYQRTSANTKISLTPFVLNSGMIQTGIGGFSNIISGLNRIGVDITRIGTGFTGVSFGLFGFGY